MTMAETTEKTKDRWDKADIILKALTGGAVAVAVVSFFGSRYLNKWQDKESDLRLYTELMSRREESDTSLRKEMFNSIITNFLQPLSSKQPDKMVLNLELLAYNFHDSLDLEPLFKYVNKELGKNPHLEQNKQYADSLVKVAREVVARQIAILEERGNKLDATIDFNELKEKPEGVKVIDDFILVKSGDQQSTVAQEQIQVTVLKVDPESRELEIQLSVTPNNDRPVDTGFWVGYFDFPTLDNVRLPQDYRCSIVLRDFQDESADITFIHFPGSRASLKDKIFYDEILRQLQNPPKR
jgi:hypothetical protein